MPPKERQTICNVALRSVTNYLGVLNELHATLQTREIRYWRDKQGHEVDFILTRHRGGPAAIECTWTAKNADVSNLLVFRRRYPRGESYLVADDIDHAVTRTIDGVAITFVGLRELTARLLAAA